MMRNNTVAIVLMSLAFSTANVEASVSYSYSASLPTYVVPTGGNIPVQINLVETFTDTSLIANEAGLGGAAFEIDNDGHTGTTAAIFSGLAAGTGFDGLTSQNFDNTLAQLTESIAFTSPGVEGTASSFTRTIPLGTVTISAGSLGDVTTFDVGPNTAVPRSTLTKTNFYDLDTTNNGGTPPPSYSGATGTSFTVTTVPVPEPATATLFAAAGLLGLRRKRHPRG